MVSKNTKPISRVLSSLIIYLVPIIGIKQSTHYTSTCVELASNQLRRTSNATYLTFQHARFTMPSSLPCWRWSLTPPFHPYPDESRRFVLCGPVCQYVLAYCPPLSSGTLLCAARTFLPEYNSER